MLSEARVVCTLNATFISALFLETFQYNQSIFVNILETI